MDNSEGGPLSTQADLEVAAGYNTHPSSLCPIPLLPDDVHVEVPSLTIPRPLFRAVSQYTPPPMSFRVTPALSSVLNSLLQTPCRLPRLWWWPTPPTPTPPSWRRTPPASPARTSRASRAWTTTAPWARWGGTCRKLRGYRVLVGLTSSGAGGWGSHLVRLDHNRALGQVGGAGRMRVKIAGSLGAT